MEDASNPGNWPGQALNTAHFQYQPLSCFLKQDAFVYIVIVYLFYNKNAYQKKKKKSHPSIILWAIPWVFLSET